jgi:hypothetical protein
MIEGMHSHARGVLIGHNDAQLIPLFHIQFKDRPDALIPAPWRDERDKSHYIRAIRMSLKECKPSVVNYAMISEAWFAEYNHAPRPGMRMPREREDRKEVVVVSAGDHHGAKMKVWEIIRDHQARVTDLVEEKAEADHFEGRLHNLLAED